MQKLKAKIELDKENVITKVKDFTKELTDLCNKYGFIPQIAHNEETKENFIIVNVADLITEDDIKMEITR